MDEGDAQARADAALLERAVREGDPRIYAILVRRHQGPVRAQLRRLLGHDIAMADDLAQECFVLAWRKLHQFRGDARFATWLHRIAHTCFLQHQRKRSASTPATPAESAEGEPADPAADATTPTPDLRLDLDAALQRLSTPQRTALLYCAQLGMSHEEAAEVLELPLGTLKAHVARGKARLRELLHDWADAREECP